MEIIKQTYCAVLNSLNQNAKDNFDYFCSEIQRVANEYGIANKVTKLELICKGNLYRNIAISSGRVNIKNNNDKTYNFWASCSLFVTRKERITAIVQHELMHIKDMEDKEFKFDKELWDGLLEDKIIATSIRHIWDIYIDSRIARTSKIGISKQDRLDGILRLALNKNFQLRHCIWEIEDDFDYLWNIEKIDFPTIIDKAKELKEKVANKGMAHPSEETL
ncbi:MAG: hypothetical protein JSV30_05915 [Candidatus Omnitrophota bacterium]|nr:MAG: hypothetical protein JSV30_05915 [Candidatus Omnitrophota bacterium]